MAFDEAAADRIRKLMSRKKGFSEKKMFGGVGFLLQGNMCVGLWKEFLIVRLRRESHEQTQAQPHVRPFDITGRVMKGWAMVEPEGFECDDDLREWVRRACNFVASLPAKNRELD